LSKRIGITMLFAWLILVIILFIITNRNSYLQGLIWPNITELQNSIERINPIQFGLAFIKALIGITIFTLACLTLGLGIIKTFQLPGNKLIIGLTAYLVGEILYSFTFLTVISLGKMTPIWGSIIFLAGITFGIKAFFEYARLFAPSIPSGANREKTLSFLIVGVIGLSLFYASARLGYDAVAEYFTHAKIIAQTGQKIIMYPTDGFVVSSFHPGILFSAIIQLFGDQAARLLCWVNGLVILLAGWAIGQELGFSRRTRLFFLTLVMTSTAFGDLLGDGKVELISTAPIIVSLYWMLKSRATPLPTFFLLIGAFLGFSIISRPYNLFLVPIFTIVFYVSWFWENVRLNGWKRGLYRSFSVFWMIPSLITCGVFHLGQNQVWLDSFLAPLTYSQNLNTSDWQWQFDPASLNTLRLLYPFTITFMNTPQSLGNISPFFLGILTFLLIKTVRSQLYISTLTRNLLISALISLGLWLALFFTVVEIRYVFFIWIILFLLTAQIIAAVMDACGKAYQIILHTSLVALLIFIAARTLTISLATYSPIDSTGKAHCYDIPFCTFLEPLNMSAEIGERVFVLHAYRYYLRPDLFACSSQSQEYAILQTLAKKNDGAFWSELYRQGFRYITYEKNFAEFHSHFGTIPPPASAPEWIKITLISATKNETIHKLQAINPPFQPQISCGSTPNGIWQVSANQPGESNK